MLPTENTTPPTKRRTMRLVVRLIHATMGLLFIVTALLQLNDPDPLYWVATYLTVAVVCGAAAIGWSLATLGKIAIGMSLAGILISAPGTGEYLAADDFGSITQGMSGDKPYIESVREFGGLFVALVYLIAFQIAAWRGTRNAS